jgi:diguanylate cyclase (GGDEF)-like protein/PAS domain S-box-containing protein
MIPPNTGFSAALLLAGLICFIGGLIILQARRNALGSVPLMILMFALSWWDITYSLFWAKAPAPYPNFWLYITYVGVVIVPTAVLLFAMQISELNEWIKRPFVIGLCLVPVLVLTLMFTDSYHGLFFAGKATQNIGMILNAGPVYWANTIYSYILVLIGMSVLVRRFRQTSGIYRSQLGIILFGIGFPWVNSIIFLLGLSPFENADNTPLSFTITGLAFTYALLQYRLLDILPIARGVLIESMSDGVVVLDSQNRLVDFNAAASRAFGLAHTPKIGQPAREIFATWADVAREFSKVNDIRTEVLIDHPVRTFLDLKIAPLYDGRKNFIGRLVVWRDITPLKTAQTELQELATRDPLTGLFNRRHLDETLEREISRAKRENHPISLVIIDIDHFKKLNDTFGHARGDAILQSFAKQLLHQTRTEDTVYRYGGEEFLVVLPDVTCENALQIAEKWRASFEESHAVHGNELINITVSCGIAEFPLSANTGEELIAVADKSLYHAKAGGRNRVVTWQSV